MRSKKLKNKSLPSKIKDYTSGLDKKQRLKLDIIIMTAVFVIAGLIYRDYSMHKSIVNNMKAVTLAINRIGIPSSQPVTYCTTFVDSKSEVTGDTNCGLKFKISDPQATTNEKAALTGERVVSAILKSGEFEPIGIPGPSSSQWIQKKNGNSCGFGFYEYYYGAKDIDGGRVYVGQFNCNDTTWYNRFIGTK
ncbi:MAG: hypothetical protein H0U75_09875 [Legionella sp.]|nr:hypothetical protein [Legionella sp.]